VNILTAFINNLKCYSAAIL